MSIYIICEIGINHNGSLETAKALIEVAKEIGADAVKFQKRTLDAVYTAGELARPRESVFGTTNGDLKRGLEFSLEGYAELFDYCEARTLGCAASCWDARAVEEIAAFSPPWLKIPSALMTDHALLKVYRQTGLPLLVSTGMSSWEEIDEAVTILTDVHPELSRDLTLLHCHSSYPSPLDEINLACIQSLKARYGLPVGYSSHTVSPWPCLMAAVCGAAVIEFHLTLDRSMWGSDQAASLEPAAAKKLIAEIRQWEICQGDGEKRVYPSELPVKAKLRR